MLRCDPADPAPEWQRPVVSGRCAAVSDCIPFPSWFRSVGQCRWLSSPDMPRIISAIMAVQATAKTRKPALTTPAISRATAMASIGMQHAIIIQPCPPCPPE